MCSWVTWTVFKNHLLEVRLYTNTPPKTNTYKGSWLLNHGVWGPLHTRDWEPVTITLQALSLVEMAELLQVRYCTPWRLRDQRSLWMHDGCEVYMISYMTSDGSCVHVSLELFSKITSWRSACKPTPHPKPKPIKAHGSSTLVYEGHFKHAIESPWSLHFKRSHWWKWRSRSKFATSHCDAWGTNRVCECTMDVKFTWILTWHLMYHVFMCHLDCFQNHLLEVRLYTNTPT